MIVPNRQPEAPLISAILEFDAEIDENVLKKEREATLRDGSSIMYDTTAFNFTMMYGLEAVTVPEYVKGNLSLWEPSSVEIDVDDEACETLCNNVTERMAKVIELQVPLLTEVGVGANWDEAH